MSRQGCTFCIDAPEVDFDYCRVCGRTAASPASPSPKPESPVERACRIASGKLQGEEIEQSIRALNRVSQALVDSTKTDESERQ